MSYINAKAGEFEGPNRKYEMVGFNGYCVLSEEAQAIRLGERVSLTKVYKPITEQKTFSSEEEVKIREITSPKIREGLLKIIRFSK